MTRVFISYRRSDSAAITGRVYDRLTQAFGHAAVFKDVDSIPAAVDFASHIQDSLRQCGALVAVIGSDWLNTRDADGLRRLEHPGDFVRIEIETAHQLGLTILPILVENATMPPANELPISLQFLTRLNAIPVRNDPDFSHDIAKVIVALESRVQPAEVGSYSNNRHSFWSNILSLLGVGSADAGQHPNNASISGNRAVTDTPQAKAPVPSTQDNVPLSTSSSPVPSSNTPNTSRSSGRAEDWSDAPLTRTLFGREHDVAAIVQSISDSRERLIALIGIGGIGKSALAEGIARAIQRDFDYIYWRSLGNAPLPAETFARFAQLISGRPQDSEAADGDAQIASLLTLMQQNRCLLVLDNFESVMQSGNRAGMYRTGYEGYGRFLQRVMNAEHNSCVIVTSREKPRELPARSDPALRVFIELLTGLSTESVRELLASADLHGTAADWERLNQLYAGNPLLLNLVAQPIQEIFGGGIDEFLKQGHAVFGDIRDPLDFQFSRLSEVERELLYWLAIERQPASVAQLQANIVRPLPAPQILEAVDSLRRRSLVELNTAALLMLQPVILEYVTDQFVTRIINEITAGAPRLLITHALLKAQARDYVRAAQRRLIVTPVVETASGQLDGEALTSRLNALVEQVRGKSPALSGYVAGNVLNLALEAELPIQRLDFRDSVVLQGYLQGYDLHDALFAHATFGQCLFTDTFGVILAVSASRDGKLLAAASADGELRVWRTEDGAPTLTQKAHSGWVRAVAYHPSGSYLATGGDDQIVRLWNVETGICEHSLSGHTDWILAVAWDSSGQRLISASQDGFVRIWDVATGECLRVLHGHEGGVLAVAWDTSGQSLISGGEDATVRIWDMATGECLRILKGHEGSVLSVACATDGQRLLSGGEDMTARVWDTRTGECLHVLRGHDKRIRSVAWQHSGEVALSASDDRSIRVWDVSTGISTHILTGHTNTVRSVAMSSVGNLAFSGGEDDTVRIWDIETGDCVRLLQGHTAWVWGAAFGSDGRTLAATEDQHLNLWDVASGTRLQIFDEFDTWIWSVAFAPNGKYLVSGNDDDTVRIWDVVTGRCANTLRGHSSWVWSVAIDPASTHIASGCEDGQIKIWDIETGACVRTLIGHTNRVRAVAFSPDGHLIASGSDDSSVRLWDAESGVCIQVWHGHQGWAWSVAFSPDGAVVASGSDDKTIRLWSAITGECFATIPGHPSWIRSISFNHAGNLLATGGEDGTVRVWDLQSQQWTHVLGEPSNRMRSVTFSPDDSLLAGGGEDGTVKLWRMETSKCVRVLRSNRPYERMDITGAHGLTRAQRNTLKLLGAIDRVDAEPKGVS